NLLSAKSLPDTDFRDPGGVVARLNDVFQMDRQNGKYFTMVYGVYDKAARTLAYCNAGHPAALLFTGPSRDAAALHRLESTDPMVGMLPPGVPFETRAVAVERYARLLLYSDGVFEIERPGAGMWKYEEFVAFITEASGGDDLMDRLYAHVRSLHGGDTLNDD